MNMSQVFTKNSNRDVIVRQRICDRLKSWETSHLLTLTASSFLASRPLTASCRASLLTQDYT